MLDAATIVVYMQVQAWCCRLLLCAGSSMTQASALYAARHGPSQTPRWVPYVTYGSSVARASPHFHMTHGSAARASSHHHMTHGSVARASSHLQMTHGSAARASSHLYMTALAISLLNAPTQRVGKFPTFPPRHTGTPACLLCIPQPPPALTRPPSPSPASPPSLSRTRTCPPCHPPPPRPAPLCSYAPPPSCHARSDSGVPPRATEDRVGAPGARVLQPPARCAV